jgi:hypothetical protein
LDYIFSQLNEKLILITLYQIMQFDMEQKQKQKRVYRKKCRGGLANCKNYVGDYKDVDGVGCCEQCDKYVDENPYDPYWEQMEQEFSSSPEYEKLEKNGFLATFAYDKAFEKFQASYEPWPIMRRRMAQKVYSNKTT